VDTQIRFAESTTKAPSPNGDDSTGARLKGQLPIVLEPGSLTSGQFSFMKLHGVKFVGGMYDETVPENGVARESLSAFATPTSGRSITVTPLTTDAAALTAITGARSEEKVMQSAATVAKYTPPTPSAFSTTTMTSTVLPKRDDHDLNTRSHGQGRTQSKSGTIANAKAGNGKKIKPSKAKAKSKVSYDKHGVAENEFTIDKHGKRYVNHGSKLATLAAHVQIYNNSNSFFNATVFAVALTIVALAANAYRKQHKRLADEVEMQENYKCLMPVVPKSTVSEERSEELQYTLPLVDARRSFTEERLPKIGKTHGLGVGKSVLNCGGKEDVFDKGTVL
jgi:hypothetical protein